MNKEIYDKNTEWYKKTYRKLVEKSKARGLKKKNLDFYTEKHHIIPKCMGGEDNDENLVLLTYREHVIAHMILSRIYDDNLKLKHVVYFMLHNKNYKGLVKIHNTRFAEELRLSSIEYLRSINKNRIIKPEWIEKSKQTKAKNGLSEKARISQAKGRVGMIFTAERKKKMSIANKGKKVSIETRKKQSIAQGRKIQAPNGIVYNSFIECCEKEKISQYSLRNWIKNYPEKGYKYLSNPKARKVVDPDGEIHDSIRKCAKKYNRDGKCIKNWIENCPERGFKYLQD